MNETFVFIVLAAILAVAVLRSRYAVRTDKGLVSPRIVTGSSVIRELGQATLFVHQREEEGVSAHMIVWHPVASETEIRVQDAHVALCMFPGGRIEHQMIEDALALAQAKLATLKTTPEVAEEVAPAKASADPAIKLRKVPVLYRGTILQMGNMPRTQEGDKTITMYGVKYSGDDGAEDTIWGVHLRRELKAVGAGVCDRV